MTQAEFLAAYERIIKRNYSWTADLDKLARFMATVRETITTDRAPWAHAGESSTSAWREIGGKGKPSLKALRALPAG